MLLMLIDIADVIICFDAGRAVMLFAIFAAAPPHAARLRHFH